MFLITLHFNFPLFWALGQHVFVTVPLKDSSPKDDNSILIYSHVTPYMYQAQFTLH